jgi:hypothetical protein
MDFTLKVKIRDSGVYAVLYDDQGKDLQDYFESSLGQLMSEVAQRTIKYAITMPGNRLILQFVAHDESL